MTTFALTCPTSCDMTPGSYPSRTYQSIGGATRTRIFGDRPTGATLRASFLCSTADAATVWEQYDETFSGANPIDLPAAFFVGHEELANRLPPGIRWHMTRPPEISRRVKGLVDLTVEFVSRLEAA